MVLADGPAGGHPARPVSIGQSLAQAEVTGLAGARVGLLAGEWAFSADSGSISVWDFERIARQPSAGTDLVLLQAVRRPGLRAVRPGP